MLLDDLTYRRAAAHGSGKVREFTTDVLSPRRRALLAALRQLALTPLDPQRAITSAAAALAAAVPNRPS